MQPITFCIRCRGMKVGFNSRYVRHNLVCRKWLAKSSKVVLFLGVAVALAAQWTPFGLFFKDAPQPVPPAVVHAAVVTPVPEDTLTVSIAKINRLL